MRKWREKTSEAGEACTKWKRHTIARGNIGRVSPGKKCIYIQFHERLRRVLNEGASPFIKI